ncbi:MAG: CRISPR system precrRNA processing endoribonuclease RAMP protein Cas6 [Spirochaetaceae bacterium]|nr:CRISPR system precrRNA processing endoribonuclease RAMP protein Cas6 [Spirochaetaceae bacterium]
MTLSYQQFDFTLKFQSPAKVDVEPLFILRSMLGKNLRSMCCISKQSTCPECMYNKTCAYAYIFETILLQENSLLPGTNRASHPFALSTKRNQRETTLTEYNFTITLFGKAIEYLPYIYAAVVRSGKDGLFRDRTEFEVADVSIDGKSILINENQIDTSIPSKEWSFDFNNNDKTQGEILVELKSPLRFKTNGKYSLDFTASEFMKCLYRRAKTLCMLYGTWEDEFNHYEPTDGMLIEGKNLRWLDFNHYSARQKRGMELGGAFGSFKLSGAFSSFELALFELNKIANAGKNTNFGLGQIDFWKR